MNDKKLLKHIFESDKEILNTAYESDNEVLKKAYESDLELLKKMHILTSKILIKLVEKNIIKLEDMKDILSENDIDKKLNEGWSKYKIGEDNES